MGRFHAGAIARAGGTLVAVVDPNPLRRRSLARQRTTTFATLDELATAGVEFDVAHVCAPSSVHAELIKQALALDAHVVVEKPVAADARVTATLLAAAAERGLLLVPVHQFLFQPGIQRLLSGRSELGTLVRCAFEATTAGAALSAVEPDELVGDILPHPLALFARLASRGIEELDWSVLRPAPGELRAIAHASGTTFEITISTRGRPTRAGLEVTGTGASVRADLFHGFAVVERGAPTRARKAARPFMLAGATLAHAGVNLGSRLARRETAYPGLRELVRRTYAAIASGGPPPIDARETLAVAQTRDNILRAAAGPAPARTPP